MSFGEPHGVSKMLQCEDQKTIIALGCIWVICLVGQLILRLTPHIVALTRYLRSKQSDTTTVNVETPNRSVQKEKNNAMKPKNDDIMVLRPALVRNTRAVKRQTAALLRLQESNAKVKKCTCPPPHPSLSSIFKHG